MCWIDALALGGLGVSRYLRAGDTSFRFERRGSDHMTGVNVLAGTNVLSEGRAVGR
jgi:hypothetical protein